MLVKRKCYLFKLDNQLEFDYGINYKQHWFTSHLLNMKSIRFPFAQELIREFLLAYALINLKTS